MADEFEQASEIEQKQREISIAAARKQRISAVATGLCLHCSIEVGVGKRWCCPECRDDWSKENER